MYIYNVEVGCISNAHGPSPTKTPQRTRFRESSSLVVTQVAAHHGVHGDTVHTAVCHSLSVLSKFADANTPTKQLQLHTHLGKSVGRMTCRRLPKSRYVWTLEVLQQQNILCRKRQFIYNQMHKLRGKRGKRSCER